MAGSPGGSSAREVVLNFRLQALQEAEKAAKKVLVDVQKSTELTREEKRALSVPLRDNLALLRKQKEQLLLEARANKIAGASVGSLDRLKEPLRVANMAREKGTALVNALQGGIGGVGGLLGALGGPVAAGLAALVIPLVQKAVAEAEARIEARRRIQAEIAALRAEEAAYQADYARKLDEDPAFRRAEARKAFDATTAEEAYRAARGETPVDFLGGF